METQGKEDGQWKHKALYMDSESGSWETGGANVATE